MEKNSKYPVPKINFAVIGIGWRAEFFLRIARALPEQFEVLGVVSSRTSKREEIRNKWGLRAYQSAEELLANEKPDFVVLSISKEAAAEVILQLAESGIPILAETPPAANLSELIKLNKKLGEDYPIQIAEQYHLQPLHQAIFKLVNSGRLGEVNYARVSISHGYHAVSLLRKALGIEFENAEIEARSFEKPIVKGPDRSGAPGKREIVSKRHEFAFLDFDGKLGVYDFERDQHRSWIRSQEILIRGSEGEIKNSTLKYLKDYQTPIELELKRVEAGINQNLEGFYLKGITCGEEWLYQNPFLPARFSDDEIAVAEALVKMKDFLETGDSFYSLAEASQDQYLALMIEESFQKKEKIETQKQIWSSY
ncbi:oxidoreductase family protein [Halanaerobium saccharolyticum]|uniref:Oxidoreductase family protein n=1 Tax=Halanaerobium saccharolyticum TaxID=43595 RepID=A0A4R7YZL9_9FIRM|nr:Gfo/Idh/MocA family oxidoreductase [Halanaerobium saccharolyticum]RAK12721.1 oxidoreductase family protein [Halanaerobium saccharolyticum]TDW02934.1 oxidoreductase family protein [Halanaerobium saccharolyticum]TDX62882.1 oxidoreductase family protein [Halanaerobium saccharolyticum]